MDKRKKELFGILLRAAVAMTLFAVAIVNYDTLSSPDINGILSSIENNGAVVAVVLAMYAVKACVFVMPASLIYVAVGVVLDSWLAVLVNMVGIVIEVTLTYLLGRFLSGDYVNRILSKKKAGRKLLEGDYQNKKWAIFTVRLVPAFPIDFVSLFYGAAKSNYPLYLLLSVAGLAPRVILFTVLGDNIFRWIPLDKIILIIICAIPIAVTAYLIKKLVIDKRKKSSEE